MESYEIGIDEAGRGPLAGPVAVGAVLIAPDFDWNLLDGVTDSKKLSESKRESFFHAARRLRHDGLLDYQVALVGPGIIDDTGIASAIRQGIVRVLRSLSRRNRFDSDAVPVLLDGSLRAPSTFSRQRTIIGGDGIERSIGLASVLAKVTRDRYMQRMAAKYPAYRFDVHKGYGTRAHRACITEHGLSDMHRKTFCTRLNTH